jgi:hypothetical protein
MNTIKLPKADYAILLKDAISMVFQDRKSKERCKADFRPLSGGLSAMEKSARRRRFNNGYDK